jgi:membrane protein
MRVTWREYQRDYAGYFAIAMVYYALISLVPILLLLIAILGLLLRYSEVAALVEGDLLLRIEAGFGTELRTTLEQMFERLQHESITATIVSLAGLVIAASVLFRQLRLSFRAIWKRAPPLLSGSVRSAIQVSFFEHVVAYALVLLGGALLLAVVALMSLAKWAAALIEAIPVFGSVTGWLLALPSHLILVNLTFALLLKILPPVRLEWRQVWLPAFVCTAAWLLASEVLLLSTLFFGESSTTAGVIGGLTILMLWMNVISQVLFFGAEMCKLLSSGTEPWR